MSQQWSAGNEREVPVENLDFSQFHALDHWPWTRWCREQPYGGGWHHVKSTWQWRRRDQWFGWWFKITQCTFGKHEEMFWRSPKGAWVGCRYCNWSRPPSEKELEDHPPIRFRKPGDI